MVGTKSYRTFKKVFTNRSNSQPPVGPVRREPTAALAGSTPVNISPAQTVNIGEQTVSC